jgi:hypothetical protein
MTKGRKKTRGRASSVDDDDDHDGEMLRAWLTKWVD